MAKGLKGQSWKVAKGMVGPKENKVAKNRGMMIGMRKKEVLGQNTN